MCFDSRKALLLAFYKIEIEAITLSKDHSEMLPRLKLLTPTWSIRELLFLASALFFV